MTPRPYLSACLCFKDAAPYLAEWLAFYRTLGVEHFYLYNNESSDDFQRAVSPYIKRGVATLIDYPGRGVQHAIYAHCLKNFGARTRWMIFCDDDEFLFPVEDIPLAEALGAFECYAGVAVSWLMYGGSGHLTPPAGLVTESYRYRAAEPDAHVKCVIDPARIVEPMLIAHQFRAIDGEVVVNEYGVPMRGPFNKRPSADILRINHYAAKSRAELSARRQRVQANTGDVSPLSVEQWMALEANWNLVEDPIACRYAARVKATIEEMGS